MTQMIELITFKKQIFKHLTFIYLFAQQYVYEFS